MPRKSPRDHFLIRQKKSKVPEFYLYQESEQTNGAKAILMESDSQNDIQYSEGLTSWISTKRNNSTFHSQKSLEDRKGKIRQGFQKQFNPPLTAGSVRNRNQNYKSYIQGCPQSTIRRPFLKRNSSHQIKSKTRDNEKFNSTCNNDFLIKTYSGMSISQKNTRIQNPQRISIGTYLLQHLYKNKRESKFEQIVNRRDASKTRQAGSKGRMQAQQAWKWPMGGLK